jgi:hypothetical protein
VALFEIVSEFYDFWQTLKSWRFWLPAFLFSVVLGFFDALFGWAESPEFRWLWVLLFPALVFGFCWQGMKDGGELDKPTKINKDAKE